MPFALTNDPKLRCLVVAAAMVMFAINLDFFAVQAALPATALEFGIGTTQLQWVISGYMLALASGLVVGGRLADLLGRRTWLFIGAAVFGLASLVGGAAMSAEVLVASRVLQGAGAAILMPVSIAVVTNGFAASQTQRAVGLVFGIAAVGQALGPFIGGAITDWLGWRWVMWINVPLILLVVLLAHRSVQQSRDETAPRVIDWAGLVLIVGSVATFTYGIDKAASWGWASLQTLGVIACGLMGFGLLVVVERRVRFPLLDLDLFGIRSFSVMIVAGVIGNVAMTVTIFVAMVFLQDVEHFSPMQAGLAFVVFSGGVTLAAQISGRLERFAPWAVMDVALLVGGLGVIGMGLGLGSMPVFLLCSLAAGAGTGLCWSFASVVTQAVAPAQKAGGASGVVLTALIGSGGVGVAAASSFIELRSAGQSADALVSSIGQVLIATGVLSVLFVPIVTWLGRMKAKVLAAE